MKVVKSCYSRYDGLLNRVLKLFGGVLVVFLIRCLMYVLGKIIGRLNGKKGSGI